MCLASLSLSINNDNFVLTDWYSSFQETQLYTRVAVAGFFGFIVEEVSLVNGKWTVSYSTATAFYYEQLKRSYATGFIQAFTL